MPKPAVLLQDIVGSALHKKVVLEAARKSAATAACLALHLLHSNVTDGIDLAYVLHP